MQTLNNMYSVANMIVPKEGPKVVPVILDFSGIDTIELDGNQIVTMGGIDYIQTIYIDNSENTESVSIRSNITNQVITCPPHSQGNFNVFTPNMPKFYISTDGALEISIFFCNFPLIPCVWGTTSSGGGGGNVTVDGGTLDTVTTITDPVTVISPVYSYDESIVSLTGGDDELIPAGDASLGGAVISNPIGNDPVSVNLAGGDATVSGMILNPGGTITLDAISNAVNAAGTNGQDVIVYVKVA